MFNSCFVNQNVSQDTQDSTAQSNVLILLMEKNVKDIVTVAMNHAISLWAVEFSQLLQKVGIFEC